MRKDILGRNALKRYRLKRRLSNILLLLILSVILIGIYYNINNSKAEDIISVKAVAIDKYGYLNDEEIKLEAKYLYDDLYSLELPENINGKKINNLLSVTVGNDEATLTEENTENTEKEPEENVTDDVETNDAENVNEKDETSNVENLDEKTETNDVEKVEENKKIQVINNAIKLTKEQLKNISINLEVEYDVAILEQNKEGEYNKNLLSEKTEEERQAIEITEDTKVLYKKELKYEDESQAKVVELKGYLPKDAELRVEQVAIEDIQSLFEGKTVTIAYDIKIVVPQRNEKGEIEYKEINPEDFGEKCEVAIQDVNIAEDAQVYHIKEDNTVEEVEIKENAQENVTFDASSFSIYAVTSNSDISTMAATENSYYMCAKYTSSGSLLNKTEEYAFVFIQKPETSNTYTYLLRGQIISSQTNWSSIRGIADMQMWFREIQGIELGLYLIVARMQFVLVIVWWVWVIYLLLP